MMQEVMMQAGKLWRETPRGRAELGVESTGDNVESEAEWCQEALSMQLDTTAMKITICTQSKRW